MPVRINLKEVFVSDPEEITLDKINFNFNELIRLGLGKKGDIGLTGPEGSIGPYGLQGIPGERGNKWFTGVGNPNGQSFVDLKDRDFFLDGDSSSIWEYDADSDTWSLVTDLSVVVSDFLAEAGQTFKRGFGEGSPQDQRFITFLNRDDSINDSSLGNASTNDIFFLHNFEELDLDIVNFATTTNDYFNALESIYVQQTISPVGRYHLEFGALYDDVSISPAAPTLTDVNENLKLRYLKQNISSPLFANSNPYVTISRFSMSIPETGGTYKGNGIFEFVTPKYNVDSDPYQGDLTLRIGSREGVSEFSSGSIDTDGIEMAIAGSLSANIGFALDFEGTGDDYFVINTTGLEAVFVNNEILQDRGNITQRATDEFPLETKRIAPSNLDWFPEAHWKNQGFAIAGTKMIAVSGSPSPGDTTSIGYIQTYDLTDPANPTVEVAERRAAIDQVSGGPFGPFTPTTYIMGSGLADVQLAGEYIYTVNNCDTDTALVFSPFTSYNRVHFQIARYEGDGFRPIRQSYLRDDATLDGAYRLEVRGRYAYVITNDQQNNTVSYGGAVARFTSIDISDPENPVVADSFNYSTIGGDKFVDIDVQDKKAAVLRLSSETFPFPSGSFSVDLVVFDISDPTNITEAMNSVFGTSILSGSSGATTTNPQYGGVKMKGNYAFIAYKDQLFVYDVHRSFGGSQSPTQLATLNLSLPTGEWAIDIEVVGRYAYVLADDRTTDPDSPAVVVKIDISDPNNPTLVSSSRIPEMAKASRLKYSGKYLYAVTAIDSTTSPNQNGGIAVIDMDGFDSPGAQIDNLRSSTLDVSMEAHIQRLNVSDSLNVGPGGIYVDAGQGIVADGEIESIISSSSLRGLVATINNDTTYLESVVGSTARVEGSPEFDSNYFGHYSFAQGATFNSEMTGFYARFDNNTYDGTNMHGFLSFYTNSSGSGTKWGIRCVGEDKNSFGGRVLAQDGIALPNEPTSAGPGNRVALRFDGGTGDDVGKIIFSASTLASIVSDRSLKKNITPLGDISENFAKLSPVSFEYKDEEFDKGIKLGFIAQEVQELFPDIVFDLNGLLNMDKFSFTALNTKMIQTLSEEIKEKDQRIKELEDRLRAIEEKLGL